MAKSITQKFLSFKSRHKLTNLDIIKIATEYAKSNLDFAMTHFTSKYHITEHVFYQARDYAIICCLVDSDLYKKIKEKSSTNYKNNNSKNSAKLSIAHFDELLVQQKQFLNEFSEKDILDIGLKYAEGIKPKQIAYGYDTGEYAIKKLLKKGIVNLLYDTELVNKISELLGSSLDVILDKRKTNKNALLNCYLHQIAFLESKVIYYDLYYRHETNKPSLKDLEEELNLAHNKYKETLKL